MRDLVRALPKAELHIHIEGTLEPELMFRLAERNGVEVGFRTVDEVHSAYRFLDLQSFLDIYYRGAAVLRTAEDFAELMSAYLARAAADGVRHAEVFFDPQTHTGRGVGFDVFLPALHRASVEAEERLGITSSLIMCFLRHLTAAEASATLDAALPYRDMIIGVGLDSTEIGHPPVKFDDVFLRARQLGLRVVAHAGEEAPASHVWGALDILGAERVDHGVRSEDDPALVERLVEHRIPLTMCPLSNVALRVVDRLEDHNLKRLLDRGVVVTINSDDPAYFGGYLLDNYMAAAAALDLSAGDICRLTRNSIEASFMDEERKERLVAELLDVAEENGVAIAPAP
jgi:adenosine deaminase